jgi:hypothetical protein
MYVHYYYSIVGTPAGVGQADTPAGGEQADTPEDAIALMEPP